MMPFNKSATKPGDYLTLSELELGQEAKVVAINHDSSSVRSRVLSLGITLGVTVSLIKKALGGDTLQIALRGFNLSLRKALADEILVQLVASRCSLERISLLTTLKDSSLDVEPIPHTKIGEAASYLKRRLSATNFTKAHPARIYLVGNPNSGKTTLFNHLTKSHQKISNFPGVTIERFEGLVAWRKDALITDLPGIYSLLPYSSEEAITRSTLILESPDAVINVIDINNLERSLALTLQLIELNYPMVIALNMVDELKGLTQLDLNGLELALKVPVVPISALHKEGLGELVQHAINVASFKERPPKLDLCGAKDANFKPMHRCIHSIMHLIEERANISCISVRFAASKLIEGDKWTAMHLNLTAEELATCDKIIYQMETDMKMDRQAAIYHLYFHYIEALLYQKRLVKPIPKTAAYHNSQKLDRFLMGKWSAVPIFILIMGVIFYLTFGPIGQGITSLAQNLIRCGTSFLAKHLNYYHFSPWISLILLNSLGSGVGAVLSFLPMMVMLYTLFSILESTGYLARIAFVTDYYMRKIGLSGRSFIPLLLGLGCSVPAIMATRTLASERDRYLTIMLTSFISCSAKLPVYLLLTSIFFKQYQSMIVLALYLTAFMLGTGLAYLLKLLVFKDAPSPLIIEMPNYRWPSFSSLWRLVSYKTKGFVNKIFTIIIASSTIITLLKHLDLHLNFTNHLDASLLATLGRSVTLVFKPLGLTDWRMVTALISGLVTKENIISTLSVLTNKISDLATIFSPKQALSLMLFTLLYTPCTSALGVIKQELGKTYMVLVATIQLLIAWVVVAIFNLIF